MIHRSRDINLIARLYSFNYTASHCLSRYKWCLGHYCGNSLSAYVVIQPVLSAMPQKRPFTALVDEADSSCEPNDNTMSETDKDIKSATNGASHTIAAHRPPPDSQITPSTSLAYWTRTTPTVTGMLGGYPQISSIDLTSSRSFLSKLRRMSTSSSTLPQPPAKLRRVADCGAGIGRVTTGFLSRVAVQVDVVEPVKKFTDQFTTDQPHLFTGEDACVGDVFNIGLAEWVVPKRTKYDVVWCQWCVGHLNDEQLVAALKRIKGSLEVGGWVVVKENVSTGDGEVEVDIFDEEDSSVTRSDGKYKSIFDKAGMVLRRDDLQRGFGRELGLFPVRMYGLQPK